MRDEGESNLDRLKNPVSETAAIGGGLVALVLFGWLAQGAMDPAQAIRSVGWWQVTGACVAVVVITVNAYFKPEGYWGWCVVVMTGMVGLWLTAAAAFGAWKGVALLAGVAAGVGVGGVAVLWVWVMLDAMRTERKRRMRGFEVGEGRKAVDEV